MRITRVHIENYRSIRELDLYPDSAAYFHSHPAEGLPIVLVQAVRRICWLNGHERPERRER